MLCGNTALRRARFEALEKRQLMAGDVSVEVIRGNLVIEGDALGNEIMMTAGTEAGSFVVTGLNGTSVLQDGVVAPNGATVTGVRRDVRVDLGAGNDAITVVDADFRGDLRIRMGEGEDEVSIDEANMRGRLSIETGAANDMVALGSEAAAGVAASGLENGELDGTLNVRNGVHVDLGDGNDELTLDQVAARGSITAIAGLGDDAVSAASVRSHAFAVLGGEGEDAITLNEIQSHHLGVHAGEGNDEVAISDSVFTSLGVLLGDGDDELLTDNLEARIAVMLGGDSEDTLEVVTESDFRFDLVRGFEVPADANVNNFPFLRHLGDMRFLDRLGDLSEGFLSGLLGRIGHVGRFGRRF